MTLADQDKLTTNLDEECSDQYACKELVLGSGGMKANTDTGTIA